MNTWTSLSIATATLTDPAVVLGGNVKVLRSKRSVFTGQVARTVESRGQKPPVPNAALPSENVASLKLACSNPGERALRD